MTGKSGARVQAGRRRSTRVRVGRVVIGGDSPVAVQSMTNTSTSDVSATVRQIRELEKAGCEIVRVAIKDAGDAKAIKEIKRRISIPIVCDIHFDYRLALASIASGADKIRINPGNMRSRDEIAIVAREARRAGIPVRIGANSGSIEGRRRASGGNDQAMTMVRRVLDYVKIFEDNGHRAIVISLKASDVAETVRAYRIAAGKCAYPLHLGITASGPTEIGIVKSSIGIGSLLLDGIGDTIRVSLTAHPVKEVEVGRHILSAVGLRMFGHEIISCPTCGRCQVDLISIVNELERALERSKKAKRPLKIAVMGCEVNGPGEASGADVGVAAGRKSGALFIGGRIVRRVRESDFVKEIMKEISRL